VDLDRLFDPTCARNEQEYCETPYIIRLYL